MEHLDYDTLATLRQVMEDDFELLIETFAQDSKDRIHTLRVVITTGEADQIRRAAHSFKGSSSNIGAPRLSMLCHALEKKALANEFNDMDGDVDVIEQEFGQVITLLRAYL